MEWAAKREGAVTALALAIFIGLSVLTAQVLGESEFAPQKPSLPLTCFDGSSSTLRVTQESSCPGNLIPLGNSALEQLIPEGAITTTLHPLLQARFDAAAQVAEDEGIHLYITSGFRSKERQAFLFEREVAQRGSETEAAKWVLPAQFSHHPLGLAIDVNYPGDRAGAAWLEANGSRFGLCRVYANEWWHFEGAVAPGQDCPAMAPNALVDLR